MITPLTFDTHMVYRVRLSTDTHPEARLAIGPIYESGCVRFFDTLRERIIEGQIISAPKTPRDDTIPFATKDGVTLYFEPLNLERYSEIAHQIDGQPHFQSTEQLQSFYRHMAGLS